MTVVGVGQADFQVADPAQNRQIIQQLLTQASQAGVEILTLPELANSGYALAGRDEALSAAEVIPDGPTSQLLRAWSAPGRLVCCGLCEVAGDSLYNSAVLFGGGEFLDVYRKAHLFMREPEIFTTGPEAPAVVEYKGWRVGTLICYDWAFPEFSRLLALKGAQLVLHPSNLVLPYGQSAMRVRSIENRFFSATANRFGEERGIPFSGASQITSTTGELLCQAPGQATGVFTANLDLSLADDKNITPFNHVLGDRRVELYPEMLRPYPG